MAWYQCSCGALKEETPHLGDTLVSVYHVHRSARLDGGSAIVRMEQISVPPSGREACLENGGAGE